MEESGSSWDLLESAEFVPELVTLPGAPHWSRQTPVLCNYRAPRRLKVEPNQNTLHTGLSGDIIDEIPMGILAPKFPRGGTAQ